MAFATVASVIVAAAVVTTASAAAVCSNSIAVDNGRGHFWACVEGECVTAHIRYPGIATNPTITLCQQRKSDGSACYSVYSQNICNGIPLRTKLGVIRPDFTGTIWIPAGFQSHPPKVCFQPPESVCSSSNYGGVITITAPPPTTTSPSTTAPSYCSGPSRLSGSDRQAIVAQHNYFRKTTLPAAANMKKMTYDLSLEQFAQSYLDRVSGCPLQHNPQNRDYGQNVYRKYSFGNTDNTVDYEYIVSRWHNEASDYNYYTNKCKPNKPCGHYTQILWDNTERVGCGMKQCNSGSLTYTLVVCNYDPPGNIIPYRSSTTRRPFTSGSRCSRCPSSHRACQQGLCVKPAELAREQLQATNMMMSNAFDGQLESNGKDTGMELQEWDMGAEEAEGEMKGFFLVEVEEEGKVGEGGWDPSAVSSVLESPPTMEQNTANEFESE